MGEMNWPEAFAFASMMAVFAIILWRQQSWQAHRASCGFAFLREHWPGAACRHYNSSVMKVNQKLLRITAPHFVAGAVFHGAECVEAAPIIRWMVGKPAKEIHKYLVKKGWKWELL